MASASCRRRRQVVAKTLEGSNQEEKTDWGVMKEKIRADLKRYIVKETSRRPLIMPVILECAIGLPACRRRQSAILAVDARYLEDASGFRGHAERVIVPADEAALSAALREASGAAIAVTLAGAGTGIHWRARPVGRLGYLAGKVHTPRNLPGIRHRRRRRAAERSSLRGTTERANFIRPIPPRIRLGIGGTIATNASGSRSFRFGSTRRWVERLRVVLGGRTAFTSWARARQSISSPGDDPAAGGHQEYRRLPIAAGHGLDRSICRLGRDAGGGDGSALGLLPAPAAMLSGVVFFPDDGAALGCGGPVARDGRQHAGIFRPALARSAAQAVSRRSRPGAGGHSIRPGADIGKTMPEVDAGGWSAWRRPGRSEEESWFALSAADRERFRRFRHALPELVNDTVRRSGALKMNTDYAVPAARNREMLAYYRRRLEAEFPGRYVIFGHIGDAHLHVNIFSDPADPGRANDLLREFARQAVALGGTVSAEHGLGKRKAHLLELQYRSKRTWRRCGR